jgi:hypothetical protein
MICHGRQVIAIIHQSPRARKLNKSFTPEEAIDGEHGSSEKGPSPRIETQPDVCAMQNSPFVLNHFDPQYLQVKK